MPMFKRVTSKKAKGEANIRSGDTVYLIDDRYTRRHIAPIWFKDRLKGRPLTVAKVYNDRYSKDYFVQMDRSICTNTFHSGDLTKTPPKDAREWPELSPWFYLIRNQKILYSRGGVNYCLMNKPLTWNQTIANQISLVDVDPYWTGNYKLSPEGIERARKKNPDDPAYIVKNRNTTCWAGFLPTVQAYKETLDTIPSYIIMNLDIDPYGETRGRLPWRMMSFYLNDLIEHGMLPKSTFKSFSPFNREDNKSVPEACYVRMNISKMTRERFFWYGSCIRNITEHAIVVRNYCLVRENFPQMHPILAYLVSHVEDPNWTTGHSNICAKGIMAPSKMLSPDYEKLILYALRIVKFLQRNTSDYFLETMKTKEMWKLNNHLHGGVTYFDGKNNRYVTRWGKNATPGDYANSSSDLESRFPKPIKVNWTRPKEMDIITWKEFLNFNPITRTFEENENV